MIIQNKIFTGIPDVKYVSPKLLLEDFKVKDEIEFSSNKIIHENSSPSNKKNSKEISKGFQRDPSKILIKSSSGESWIEINPLPLDSKIFH